MGTATKSIYIPQPGDFLTDGKRLIEVVERCREGYHVLDVANDDDDPRGHEILTTEDAVRIWSLVKCH